MRPLPLLIVIALLVAGCRPPPDEAPSPPPARLDASNPLEQAAREADLVVDPATTAPTGLFERTHAAGHDGVCFKPDGGEGSYRFGFTASFGSAISCEGSGSAQHDGNVIHLTFDNADCVVDAAYDGNQVRMPGRVAPGCASLCDQRGNVAGITIDRTGWTAHDAAGLTSRRDMLADRPARALCH